MKLGSQQLKEEMGKLKSIGGGFKLNIGNVEQENYDEGREGWAKFLNFISTKTENTQFNNHLKEQNDKKIESINKLLEKVGTKLTVEHLKDNLLKTPPAAPRLPTNNQIAKPKSRMGIFKVNSDIGRNELTESKDFELFFQKELLPKELQKVNPMLLGLTPGSPLRTLSPVCREVTEEEKDIIKMKYKLSKMTSMLNNERKTIKHMMTRIGTPKLNMAQADLQRKTSKGTDIYRFSKLGTNVDKNRNNSCISPQPQIRFSGFNKNFNSRGLTLHVNKELNQTTKVRVLSCDKTSEKLSSVSENSDTDESTTKNINSIQPKQIKNMRIFMKNQPKKIIIQKVSKKTKLNKTQIQVVNNMISSKLKFDINHSNILKKQKNKRRTIVTNMMHRRNIKSVSPIREDMRTFSRNHRMQTTLKP